MPDPKLIEKARLHVRRWFAKRMPASMVFHDLDHTLEVTRTAVGNAQAMKVDAAGVRLLELAALFHDTGYAIDPAQHELHSARLAAEFMRKQGCSEADVRRVSDLVLATRMGVQPRTKLQRILRDADSAKAGQVDFNTRSELLRSERGNLHGSKPSKEAWLSENLAYLKAHRFHTRYAQQRYGGQKRLNLQGLLNAVGKAKSLVVAAARERFHERDLSWLSFNERVLQEAQDPAVPLLERIKFLAIYSNNLDEFYRVRVASLRSLNQLNKAQRAVLDVPNAKLVERINRKALGQQQQFGKLYRDTLLPALARQGIRLLRPGALSANQRKFLRQYFEERVVPLLNTASVRAGNAPFIEDRKLYFVVRLKPQSSNKQRLVLVNVPSDECGRFVELPSASGRSDIVFLDDVMRLSLGKVFKHHKITGCHAIKLSRDAELYLDEEFSGNMKDKVRKSLRKRRTGVPARFLYDNSMPQGTLRALRTLLGLSKPDMVAGGRYHNFSDLMKLPVKGYPQLRDEPWPALQHPAIAKASSTFRAIAKQDLLLHFPYHDFNLVVNWLREAATDQAVRHIAITLYRVAHGSAVCEALLEALRNGKQVTVFVEVQARFDEGSNLYWGEALEQAGATVLYSYEGLKVHCKLCLVERTERGRPVRYAYVGTGNFNEGTSRIYVDSALLTRDPGITAEVNEVFAHLKDRDHRPALKHLMVAPLTLRSELERLIDREIELAQRGAPAEMLLKMNSLEDRAMIRKLYDASCAGVRIRIILRGICCLVPGVKGLSEHIQVISIVDRYLEHTRAYVFGNGGDPLVYLSSADWMGRNLDRRIEVATPLLDPRLRKEMLELLEIQWNDRVKARWIDVRQANPYRKASAGELAVHAQSAAYTYLGGKVSGR